jgi:hypothetical protein
MVAYLDTEEAAKHTPSDFPRGRACPEREQHIDKLVIDKLEIGEQGPAGQPKFTINPNVINPALIPPGMMMKTPVKGGSK